MDFTGSVKSVNICAMFESIYLSWPGPTYDKRLNNFNMFGLGGFMRNVRTPSLIFFLL